MKLALALFSSLVLTACSDSKSGNATNISTDTIQGAWQVTSVSYQGKTAPYGGDNNLSQKGYPSTRSKSQYLISGNRLRTIESDEIAVQFQAEAEFTLADNKIVTKDTGSFHLAGFTILQMGAVSMTIKPEHIEPDGFTFTLTKIDTSELATNKLKPVAQHLEYSVSGPTLQFGDQANDSYGAPPPAGPGTYQSCRYYESNGQQQLSFGFYSFYASSNGQSTTSSDMPGFDLRPNLKFDFSRDEESIPVSSQGDLFATYNANGTRYSLSGGTCMTSITRRHRLLDISGNCTGVTATSSTKSETVNVQFKQSCLLNF